MNPRLLVPFLALTLAACDIPGMGPDPRIAQREAEGKAIGGACRYALRGIEECYLRNPKAPKTAIFDGWKDMDVYMRENKLAGQAPGTTYVPGDTQTGDAPESAEGGTDTEKSADQGGAKAAEKTAEKMPGKPSDKSGDKSADKNAGKKAGAASKPSAPAAQKG